MKFGPPESPKHVPPELALLESRMAKSPTFLSSMATSFGVANRRIFTSSSFHDADGGKLF